MAGYALVGVEALDGLGREPHFELMPHQLVWHGVEVAIDLDVVVDMDAHFFPFGVDIGVFRQPLQCWLVEGLEG
ncbi:hypothetical protein ALQ73_200125 [Pseudomonas savastanoi pv. glycinea]|uniref:Uncharacterized protein n=1 Tax=Pseudomonas savastanoi pv. glycinea TaxID=318 RepID=A0A3M3FMB8_PSESG|nr:hypothetical protein ALQ73_200125 [Pseudomonas savastanoi pv. glycinea]